MKITRTASVGQPAPDFTLPGTTDKPLTLSSLRGRPVALVFFPHAFTGRCTDELCELRDNLAMFQAQDVTVLGISVDPAPALNEFKRQQGYQFELLSDFWPHGAVSREYGVFAEDRGLALRGSFLVDADGIITWSLINEMTQSRRLEEYRAALAALDSPKQQGSAPADLTQLLQRIPVSEVASRLGTDEQTAARAMAAALPALLAQLQDNASAGDADNLAGALARHNNNLVTGNRVEMDRVDTADGNKILDHVFGNKRQQVVQQLGATDEKAGAGLMDSLLPMLAPVAMSFLANNFLGGNKGQQANASQQGGGLDLSSLLGGVLGGRQPGQQQDGGLDLGGLLGGLFGRK